MYLQLFKEKLYLLCFICNYVEYNQHLFFLTHSCLFPLTLILCTLLSFLNFFSFRFKFLKAILSVVLQTAWKPCFLVKVYQIGCVAKAKTVFHAISKNINLVSIFFKVRSTYIFWMYFSCVMHSLFSTPIHHFPHYLYISYMIFI